jgi:hypothetical protein
MNKTLILSNFYKFNVKAKCSVLVLGARGSGTRARA